MPRKDNFYVLVMFVATALISYYIWLNAKPVNVVTDPQRIKYNRPRYDDSAELLAEDDDDVVIID